MLVMRRAALVAGCKGKTKHARRTRPTETASRERAGRRRRRVPSQQPLPQLPALELPDDPKRDEKIALGHALFFDKRLSGNERSRLLLVPPERGRQRRSRSARDRLGRQEADAPRADDLERRLLEERRSTGTVARRTSRTNAKGAWGGPNMGAGKDNLDKKAAEIAEDRRLQEAVRGRVRQDRDQGAIRSRRRIAEYMRTLVCKDTAYDKFAAGDKTALDRAAAARPRRVRRQGHVHHVPRAAVLLDGDGRRWWRLLQRRHRHARRRRGSGRHRPHEGHERRDGLGRVQAAEPAQRHEEPRRTSTTARSRSSKTP